MTFADWYPLILAALVGALTLFVLLQLGQAASVWYARRRTSTFHLHVIGQAKPRPAPDRKWLWDTLTDREMQVARLVANGYSNPGIAHELGISQLTVKSHLKSIYSKLQLASRHELSQVVRRLVE